MKSLKATLYFHIMLLVFSTSFITGMFSLVSSIGNISKHLRQEAMQISERTAQSLAFSFWNIDSIGVSEIIDAQMQNSNMLAIQLKNRGDENQFVRGMIKDADGIISVMNDDDQLDTSFVSTSAIVFEGEDLGTVTVVLSDKVLKDMLYRGQVLSFISELFLLLFLALPFTYMITKRFMSPVELLAESFRKVVESGFVSPVPQMKQREISKISDIFETVRHTLLSTFEKIHKDEKDLATTLNSITDALISIDNDGVITRFNPVASKLTGWSEDEAVGEKLSTILKLKVREEQSLSHDVFREIQTGRNQLSIRTDLFNFQDESSRTVDITSALLLDDFNKQYGVVVVIRDMTVQLKIEEELKQRRKMESLGQLSGGVAHDFNNMLGGIIGFSELLSDLVEDNSEEADYVRYILEAANSAADLTAKLLAFSRKGKMVSTPFSLHKTCETALSLLSRTINKNIQIQSELEAEWQSVTGDPSQIQNAILNLCINAKDAMPEGGELLIRTENVDLFEFNSYGLSSGKYLKLLVSDTGTGIPDDLLHKIFEPFFTTKDTGKGTGLGLAAVYGAVKNHSGEITIDSEMGVGTTFTVLLPVVDMVTEIENGERPVLEKSINKRVLVVDDEKILRVMLDKIISDMGGEVTQAADGVEAVALFREKHDEIDLVILDMVMPHMNGDACFYKLREIDDTIPIVVSSGFDKNTSISELLDAGAKAYLHKPFNVREITELLQDL